MFFFVRRVFGRGWESQLHEIMEELEFDEEAPIPDSITFFPPENCNADVTDEDSGDENQVRILNLPGSQLRTQAQVHYMNLTDSSDSEDEISLAQISKRMRIRISNPPIENQLPDDEPTPSTSTSITIPKTKQYNWISRDIRPIFRPWAGMQQVARQQNAFYYFEQLFSDKITVLLTNYTNNYINQKNKIGNITCEEMKCFIGILLFSGYVVVPRRYMYWENAADCGNPIVYNALSRDRFTFIMSHIHCCDNTNLPSNDKYAKLRPLFDALNENFLNYAPFEENYSIDEAMIPYYGGHPCKQFIRGKPIRWGYKFWVGSTRLGYILWFDPYQGQTGDDFNDYKKLGLGASVILRFADVLRTIDANAPFHLFFDNFFTSIPLLDELRERGLKATGTIRENRVSKCPLPTNKEFKKTDRGSLKYKATRAEEIIVCKWNDNSVVTVASNAAKVLPLSKVKRFSQHEKRYVQVDQPALIKVYNENMGGVDRSDQNIGLYRTSIRGKKWYFPLICHALDMAVQNAWQLYHIDGGDCDHLQFRRNIATSLLETYRRTENRKSGRSSQNYHQNSRFDNNKHLVKYNETQLRCVICHKKANFSCKTCEVTLHPKECFETYHTK